MSKSSAVPSGRETFQDAVKLHQNGDFEAAATTYRALLSIKPDNPLVWTNLGAALRSLGKLEASIICHKRALNHDPKSATTIANLGNALREEGSYREAREMALVNQIGIETGPAATVARDLQGMGRWRASMGAFNQAVRDKPQDGELRILRATSHFMMGEYDKALIDYHSRFLFSPSSEPKRQSTRWDGTTSGKRILVMAEQGLGDMVLISRFFPALREKFEEIWITSRGPTMRLFENVPYVDKVFSKDAPPEEGAEDAYVPAMDLMKIYGLRPDNCPAPPPLYIPEEARQRAKRLTAPYKDFYKIGICWAGSPTFVQAKRKATELWRFLQLAEIPGVQLFGMCKGEREADIAELGAEGLILNTAATDKDFADAAALVEQLDLVVTVDTGLGHVAATVGKPTWVLLPRPPFWYWGTAGESTYWYENMRLIRQTIPGDWTAPFDMVRADIENAIL